MSLYEHLLTKRYAPGGDGPEWFDCWGLVREIARLRGGPVPPRYHAWVDVVARAHLFERVAASDFIEHERPAPWRIVAFTVWDRNRRPAGYHVGTIIEDGRRFIHARSTCGIAINRIAGYGTLAGYFEYGRGNSHTKPSARISA
jgi:cell wall-associated NlpC family hydrolase